MLRERKEDDKKTIRLEDMPSVILESEVPEEILVPNPGDRKVVITPEESGVEEEQVFTSDCLPDEIPYELLGLIRYPDGSYHPKYVANVVTTKKLWLEGISGYKNGIKIINRVACTLISQEGILKARSIKKSDLELFGYENEELSYWLSSPGTGFDLCSIGAGPGCVCNGEIKSGDFYAIGAVLFGIQNKPKGMPIRPVMILKSKVYTENSNFA